MKNASLSSLRQGTNALGAHNLANLATRYQNRYFLQVRAVGAVGGPHGETAIVAEGCGLATGLTLCHRRIPFRNLGETRDKNRLPLRQEILPYSVSPIKDNC